MKTTKLKISLLFSLALTVVLLVAAVTTKAADSTSEITNVTLTEDGVLSWEGDAPCYEIYLRSEDDNESFYLENGKKSVNLNDEFFNFTSMNQITIYAKKDRDTQFDPIVHYDLYFAYDDTSANPVYTVTQPSGTITDVVLAKDGNVTWNSDALWFYTTSDGTVTYPSTHKYDTVDDFLYRNSGDVVEYSIISTLETGHYAPGELAAPLDKYSFYVKRDTTGADPVYTVVEPIEPLDIEVSISAAEGVDVKVDSEHVSSRGYSLITAFPSEKPDGFDEDYLEPLNAGEWYYVALELAAADGYFFNDGITVNVNGGEGEYEIDQANVGKRNSTIVVYTKVKATGAAQSTLGFTGVENIEAVTKNVGESVTLPVVTKDGYDFSKWVVVDTDGNEVEGAQSYNEGATFTFGTDDCILKAVWTEKETPAIKGNADETPVIKENVDETPKTGDTSALYLFAVLMAISAVAVTVSGKKIKVR